MHYAIMAEFMHFSLTGRMGKERGRNSERENRRGAIGRGENKGEGRRTNENRKEVGKKQKIWMGKSEEYKRKEKKKRDRESREVYLGEERQRREECWGRTTRLRDKVEIGKE